MNVAEFIIDKLERMNIEHVFCVTGGGAMYLNEALRKSNINTVFCHGEQSATMAAIGYAKLTGKQGVVMVTSGCASTNTITGLLDAYQDNVPLIVISGDSWLEDISSKGYGVQGSNIKDIVSSITNTFIQVDSNNGHYINELLDTIKYPLWINIPIDIQRQEIKYLEDYKLEIINALQKSSKQILVIGNETRDYKDEIKLFINKFNIPFCTSFNATDILNDHPNNLGRIGIKGNNIANKCLDESDLIICIGTRMNRPMIGYKGLNKSAYKILISDNIENNNNNNFDLLINNDPYYILIDLLMINPINYSDWLNKCLSYKNEYKYKSDGIYFDFYEFVHLLSDNLPDNAVVITDAGTSFLCTPTSIKLKEGQRYITSGQGDMGFAIPAAIGAAIAEDRPIVVITGDGSFQFNIQELQTISHNKLNIKIFVINNNGYLTIRNTQDNYFEGNSFGTDKDNGISFPELENIALSFDIIYKRMLKLYKYGFDFYELFTSKLPVLIEVMCLPDQKFGDY